MSAKRTCPVCEKAITEAQAPHAPFCSARCKNVDLNRWLTGGYAIAGNATGDDSEGVDLETGSDSDDEATLNPSRNTTQH